MSEIEINIYSGLRSKSIDIIMPNGCTYTIALKDNSNEITIMSNEPIGIKWIESNKLNITSLKTQPNDLKTIFN